MRTEAFRGLGGYRLDQSEDYDLWLRFEERFGIAALEEPVIRYRFHPGPVLGHEARAAGARARCACGRRRRRGGQGSPIRSTASTHLDDGGRRAARCDARGDRRVRRRRRGAVVGDLAARRSGRRGGRAARHGGGGSGGAVAADARATRAAAPAQARGPARARPRVGTSPRRLGAAVRILQISTADRGGGAEAVALSLHRALRARGHEAWLAVGYRRTDEEGVVEIGGAGSRRGRALTRSRRAARRGAGSRGLSLPGVAARARPAPRGAGRRSRPQPPRRLLRPAGAAGAGWTSSARRDVARRLAPDGPLRAPARLGRLAARLRRLPASRHVSGAARGTVRRSTSPANARSTRGSS